MNILQIVHCFPPESMTGSEIYAYNLAKGLSRSHEVGVFYRINNSKYKDYEIIEGIYNGLAVYKINNTLKRCFSLEGIYNNKDIETKFIEVLDKVKPDVVHIHHLLFLSLGIVREIKERNIPVVFTLHDYWLVCPRGQLLKANLTTCLRPLESNCLYCLAKILNIRNLFIKIPNILAGFKSNKNKNNMSLEDICNNVDIFISPSKFLRNRFIEFGIPAEKIVHLNNGMDFGLFKGVEKTGSDKIRFGFIGTLIPSKGVHILIKAFGRLKGDKAVLKIYGKSPVNNGILDYFHRIKIRAGNNKNIKFIGVFDNTRVAEVFKEIDVLVFPSIWEENSPLVLHEAILSKTPVIASDIGGVSEFIKHGENGVLFKAGDAKELFTRIQDILNNPGALDSMKNGVVKIKDIKDNSREIEEIYNRLLTR